MKKFGKSNQDIYSQTQSFVRDNDKLQMIDEKFNNFYKQQPKRSKCKICEESLSFCQYLILKDIKYFICNYCGHVNGEYEDTNKFCNFIYNKHGEEYSEGYNLNTIEKFNERTEKIFIPKAKFLLDGLIEQNQHPENLKFCDIGCGAGCFVNALHLLGMEQIEGKDVEGSQINLAQKILGISKIKSYKIEDTTSIIRNLDCDVVSLIGVLEHLQNPHDVLFEITDNKNIKYLFISVPLFSPSVLFQIAFPDVYQRHLSSGHTHLFTESSLNYIFKKYNLKIVSEWWFGLDMSDLFRSVLVSLDKTNQPDILKKLWCDWFLPNIDVMQHQLDEQKITSEVHMILKVVPQI